jgi:hypothetical protein
LGLVDAEVRGHTNDWGISLVRGNRIAFGTGSPLPKGCSTLISSKAVNPGDTIVVTRRRENGYMAIFINGKLDNDHFHGSKNDLNASSKVTLGSINIDENYF